MEGDDSNIINTWNRNSQRKILNSVFNLFSTYYTLYVQIFHKSNKENMLFLLELPKFTAILKFSVLVGMAKMQYGLK